MRRLVSALTLLCATAAAAAAQSVVDPGMSRDQVVERLGKPVGERTVGDHTYLFYHNGCEKKCGMHDVVMLQNGSVVDAVFRSASRRYTGESSSPSGRSPVNQGTVTPSGAVGTAEPAAGGGGAVITGGPPRQAARSRAARNASRNAATSAPVRGSSAGTVVPAGDSAGAPRPAENADRSPRPPMAAGGQPAAGYRTDTVAGPGSPLRAGSGNRGARPAPNYKANPADSVRNASPQRQPADSTRPPER